MKTKHIILYFLLATTLALGSCNKKTKPISPSKPLSFDSLTAEQISIPLGGYTKISAHASGEGLTYTWSASSGDIIGSGSQVTYGASSCCAGQNTITCTVRDAGYNQSSKYIIITVE